MKSDTTKFKVVEILFDDEKEGFVIAKGLWDGNTEVIGARWYEDGGIGYPQTYGKPQWFIFPKEIGKWIEAIGEFRQTLKKEIKAS